MDRDITFHKIAAGHYRNEETGVEIVKVGRKRFGRNGWRVAGWSVTAPSYLFGATFGRDEVGFATTLTAAKEPATRVALETRDQIARAYVNATAEKIDRVSRAYDDSDRVRAGLKPLRCDAAWRMIYAARTAWWSENYDQARVFAREAETLFAGARTEQVATAHGEALAEEAA